QALGLAFAVFNICDANLVSALRKHPENPWSKLEVQLAADKLMKVSYAVSCLTLDDLPAFVKKLAKETGEKKTFAEALKDQDSYFLTPFMRCSIAYHQIRGGYVWGPLPGRADGAYDMTFPSKPWPQQNQFASFDQYYAAYLVRLREPQTIPEA